MDLKICGFDPTILQGRRNTQLEQHTTHTHTHTPWAWRRYLETGRDLYQTAQLKVKSLSRVRLFVTPWTVAYQVPPSMVFSRQEYWSGLPFPSPGDLPDPGMNPGLPHCWQMLYCLSHRGSQLGGRCKPLTGFLP